VLLSSKASSGRPLGASSAVAVALGRVRPGAGARLRIEAWPLCGQFIQTPRKRPSGVGSFRKKEEFTALVGKENGSLIAPLADHVRPAAIRRCSAARRGRTRTALAAPPEAAGDTSGVRSAATGLAVEEHSTCDIYRRSVRACLQTGIGSPAETPLGYQPAPPPEHGAGVSRNSKPRRWPAPSTRCSPAPAGPSIVTIMLPGPSACARNTSPQPSSPKREGD